MLVDEETYKRLGCAVTVGTVYIRPPSRSDLYELFQQPHGKEEHILSCGARALCKHYDRVATHQFWQHPTGTPTAKNSIATLMLDKIFDNASWRNVFHLSGKEIIFEIRVQEGYGARWNIYPDKYFRGFLEPGPEFKTLNSGC